MTSRLVRSASTALVKWLSRSHIAGPELADAMAVCVKAHDIGWRTTLSYWSGPSEEPAQIGKHVFRSIEGIQQSRIDSRLSVKPQHHGYDLGFFSELCSAARQASVTVCMDATSPETANISARLIERMRKDHDNIVWTIPTRWKRSRNDIRKATELQIPVRLVKGQWVDPGSPRQDASAEFRAIAERCADSAIMVTVATHDAHLANDVIDILNDGGVRCELEQMYGLPLVHRHSLHMSSVPLRLYVPYGHPWLPYNLSLVASRPAMLGWAFRDAVLGRPEKLRSIGFPNTKTFASEVRNLKNSFRNPLL